MALPFVVGRFAVGQFVGGRFAVGPSLAGRVGAGHLTPRSLDAPG
ncbi:hypothetical protein AB0I22_01395 [Streptomyces sp. NPDC050610]